MSGEEHPEDPTVKAEVEPEPEEAARLRGELEAVSRRAEDLLGQLRRARADYENLEKRAIREAEDVRRTANEALLASLMPVLDDLDSAVGALDEGAGEGVRQIREKLLGVLGAAGLQAIDPAGAPFDPYEHEVVAKAEADGAAEGTVKEVVQRGYRYRSRLLRPAKVIVVARGERDGENHRH